MTRSYKTIYLYIISETVSSFIVAFAFFFFIFFVNQILLMAQEFLSRKVPLPDVGTLLFYNLPYVISMTIPFAALVAALMAIGRFSADNEILAFRSAGVSLTRLFMPLLLLGFVFAAISFVFNDYLLPLGYIKTTALSREIFRTNLELEFEPFMAKRVEDKFIITGDVRGRIIDDFVIIDSTSQKEKRVISAAQATLIDNEQQQDVISLELTDVFIHVSNPRDQGNYEYSRADRMIYNILLRNVTGSTAQSDPGRRGMTSFDLWKDIQLKQGNLNKKLDQQADKISLLDYELSWEVRNLLQQGAISPEQPAALLEPVRNLYQQLETEKKKVIMDTSLRLHLLEFQRKFSHPASCLIFILFAFPVGLFARKSGRIVGFAIGVIMSAAYWGMLFVAIRMGVKLTISSFIVMWMPNFVVLAIGFILASLRSNK